MENLQTQKTCTRSMLILCSVILGLLLFKSGERFAHIQQIPPPTPITGRGISLEQRAMPSEERHGLISTLTYLEEQGQFALHLENRSKQPVAVLRNFRCYNVRLFDKYGEQMTDFPTYLHNRCDGEISREVHPSDWVVLQQSQGITLHLRAFGERRPLAAEHIRFLAVAADCIYNGYYTSFPPPSFVREAGAKIVPFASAPTLILK